MTGAGDEPGQASAGAAADYQGRLHDVRQSVLEVAEALPATTAPLESLTSPDGRIASARATQAEQANTLRKYYGWALLGMLFAQVIAADVIFCLYATHGVHWKIPSTTMNVWLGATVVQVVGVVLVVVHYLFPDQSGKAG